MNKRKLRLMKSDDRDNKKKLVDLFPWWSIQKPYEKTYNLQKEPTLEKIAKVFRIIITMITKTMITKTRKVIIIKVAVMTLIAVMVVMLLVIIITIITKIVTMIIKKL